MKTLAEYLEEQGRGAAADLAHKIGVSESTVMRLARGAHPLTKTALAIEQATGGQVPVQSWRASA